MGKCSVRGVLLACASMLAVVGSTAMAQTGPSGDEIVVTANRQGAAAISKIPMNITAQSQDALDQQSVKTANDLSRIVPALRIDDVGPIASNVSIRGVRSEVGTATTGIYIDDTALQARALGGSASGGGAFIPPLFDLQRVEVLKGPQGTLYGGSSLGGTVRFITPEPSLDEVEAYGRAEINKVDHGDYGYEAGVALGMPLVQDTLGLRFSGFHRRFGGYLDYYDRRDLSAPVSQDDNWRTQASFRLALKWQASDDFSVKPSYLYAKDRLNAFSETYRDTPGFTTPAFGTVQTGRGAPLFGPYTGNGLSGGMLPPGYQAPSVGTVVTDIPGAEGQPVYIHPEHTYAPITLGPYDSLEVTNVGDDYTGPVTRDVSGRKNRMHLAGLSLDWDVGPMVLESMTSYLNEKSSGAFSASLISAVNVTSIAAYDPSVNSPFLFDTPNPITSIFGFESGREAWSQELRLTIPEGESGLSAVFGLYYNDADTYSVGVNTADRSSPREASFNQPQVYFPIHTPEEIASQNQQTVSQALQETSMAAFGEVNYAITDTLKVTVGARISREKLDFRTNTWGLLYNVPFGDGTIVEGSIKETPFTPKLTLAWQATPDNLFYATVAKGYRPGGVQGQANPTICSNDLDALGITNTPATYGSDSVWNYEAGAKLRLFDRRLQLSGSVFHVEWSKPQTPYRLPTCAFQYVTNIGHAVSQGFDLQGALDVGGGLSIDFALGYTDAHFTEDVLTEPNAQGVRNLLAGKDMDLLEVPKWTGSFGGRYEFPVTDRWDAYVFGSYQYTGKYKNTLGPGVLSYAPDAYVTPAIDNALVRLGLRDDVWDISLFADNLFANKTLRRDDLVGRQSCRDAACSTYGAYFPLVHGTTLRPRTIGLSATVRY